jgi:hypothetical protein
MIISKCEDSHLWLVFFHFFFRDIPSLVATFTNSFFVKLCNKRTCYSSFFCSARAKKHDLVIRLNEHSVPMATSAKSAFRYLGNDFIRSTHTKFHLYIKRRTLFFSSSILLFFAKIHKLKHDSLFTSTFSFHSANHLLPFLPKLRC